MVIQMTDEDIKGLYKRATDRLSDLQLDIDLADDTSGQTSAEEHLSWLVAASDEEILQWVADMRR